MILTILFFKGPARPQRVLQGHLVGDDGAVFIFLVRV